jgi:transposase
MSAVRQQSASPVGAPLRRRASYPRPAAETSHFDYLNTPGLRVTSPPDDDEFSIWVKAEQFPKFECCPSCGCDDERFKRNGTYPQTVRHVPQGLQTVYVEVRRQSYYCRRCEQPFQHPLTAVSDRWRMTSRLVDYVGKLSLLRPAREVALLTGASTNTVSEIMVEYRQHLDATVRFETPRVLGLDGVFARVKDEKGKSKKRECAIFTDIEAGLVIDLRPSITIAEVSERLRELPNPERVEIVLIDMSPALFAAVREALPHAIIVVDLFHIQSKINEGLDNVRKRLRRAATRRKGQLTMCRKELLRKRSDQLNPDELKERERWLELKPELRLAYDVAEESLKIWHSSSNGTARERYRRWLTQFPSELRRDFRELLSAFENWGEYIFNYFDHRFTNAFTESRNRLVKDIQRESRGCDFETLRGKVIYGTLLRKQIEEARREEMKRKKRKPRIDGVTKRRRRRKRKRAPGEEAESAALDLVSGCALPLALQMDLFQ